LPDNDSDGAPAFQAARTRPGGARALLAGQAVDAVVARPGRAGAMAWLTSEPVEERAGDRGDALHRVACRFHHQALESAPS